MLCDAIPSFEAMINKWKVLQNSDPDATDIIQHGLGKLTTYHERIKLVPAYVMAMSSYLLSKI